MYQRHSENPPVHRDVPPISGRISWARQLMRRIRNPMNIFERHPSCLKTPEAFKIIRNFNQLATVLVEFEILYHKGWLKQVEIAKTGEWYSVFFCSTYNSGRSLKKDIKTESARISSITWTKVCTKIIYILLQTSVSLFQIYYQKKSFLTTPNIEFRSSTEFQ